MKMCDSYLKSKNLYNFNLKNEFFSKILFYNDILISATYKKIVFFKKIMFFEILNIYC